MMRCQMKRTIFHAALLIWASGLATAPAEAAPPRILMREDFNGTGKDGFAARALQNPKIRLAEKAGPDGSDAIRVAYVGFKSGSERVTLRHPLDAKVDRATLSFDVRFDKAFQWTHGGKLHGLGPRKPITGGKQRKPDGWSARIMFKKEGRCATYLYDQDKKKKYGIGHTSSTPVFAAGQWHHVVLQVTLNDPGRSNGSARILIDNREALKSERIAFREKGGDETLIQQFLFSTFHGGSSSKWTPVDKQGNPTTVHACFDNFVVTEGIHPSRAGSGR
jgi:hypothetical protein